MSDNLKTTEEDIDRVLDETKGEGDVKVSEHNALLKRVLNTVGKYTGLVYVSKASEVGVLPPGVISWDGNNFDQTGNFVIKFAMTTADLNDITPILSNLNDGDILKFKDYEGRSSLFTFRNYQLVSGNYEVTISGYAQNSNFTYTGADEVPTVIELYKSVNNIDLSGKADLVNGTVPASQLPSYVDDVLEGEFIDGTTFNDPSGDAYTLESGKVYVDTTTNLQYRWTGSVLVELGQSAPAFANGVTEVSPGIYGFGGDLTLNNTLNFNGGSFRLGGGGASYSFQSNAIVLQIPTLFNVSAGGNVVMGSSQRFSVSGDEVALTSDGQASQIGQVWTAIDNQNNGQWQDPSGGSGAFEQTGVNSIIVSGRDENNFGDVGDNSIDGTQSFSASTILGVTGDNSVGFGISTEVSGNNSVGIGDNIVSNSLRGVAIGSQLTLSSDQQGTVAIGAFSSSVGSQSISIGYSNQATSDTSIAIGRSVLSRAGNSIAIGDDTEVGLSRQYGIAIGTQANGGGSAISIGRLATTQNAFQGIAIGLSANVGAQEAIAIGANTNTSAFSRGSIAIGLGANTQSNYDIAIGRSASGSGASTVALGDNSRTFGNGSIAIGLSSNIRNAVSSTGRAIAIGNNAITGGSRSIAIGSDSFISDNAFNAIAIGQGANAVAQNAISIGQNNIAHSFNETSLGSFGTTYTPASTSLFNLTDRLLNVGNGTGNSTSLRKDAFTIMKRGELFAPSLTNSMIDNAGSRVLITKEWFNANNSGGGGVSPTGLEAINEGSGIGHRIIGVNANNYGVIGQDAKDFSIQLSTSNSTGATGQRSVAFGIASTASGIDSIAMGSSVTATGRNTLALGLGTIAENYSEITAGVRNTSLATTVPSLGVNQQPKHRLFVIGDGFVGSNFGPQSDIFSVYGHQGVVIHPKEVNATSHQDAQEGMIRTFGTGTTFGAQIYNGTAWLSLLSASSSPTTLTRTPTQIDTTFNLMTLNLGGTGTDSVTLINPSGLEKVTEGGNSGFRMIGEETNRHGDIGESAIDLSLNVNASTTYGATGFGSFAAGRHVTASGQYSFAYGTLATATQQGSIAMGVFCNATAPATLAIGAGCDATEGIATAIGQDCLSSGRGSIAMGYYSRARAYGEVSFGHYGTDYTASGVTTNVGTDRLFNLGNGANNSFRSDAFTVFKNGAVLLHPVPLSSVTNGQAGMLVSDQSDSNALKFHDGTGWKTVQLV